MNSTIAIVDYDPVWPVLFEEEARRIRAALGERVLRVEHVGSTSVCRLAAKPIIGVVLVVADAADEAAYAPALEAAGYILPNAASGIGKVMPTAGLCRLRSLVGL